MLTGSVTAEQWALREPFTIARGTITHVPVMVVRLDDGAGHAGWAEAAGVDYDGETPATLMAQVEATLPVLHRLMPDGVVTEDALRGLQGLLPPGGARNALDCALWDLRAKQTGIPAWQTAALPRLAPLTTVFTLGIASEADTRRKARAACHFPMLKLKCNATQHLDVVRWVREEHPQARIAVDANQAWTRVQLEQLLPALVSLGVEMVEQPVARGADASLDGLQSPIPIAADESCADRASMAALAGRYQAINIKLDKCGGLTEALAMADEAESMGMQLMVGNMCGTSLAMAPGALLGQRCTWVDLDGPLLQVDDRAHAMACVDGVLQPPSSQLWG